MPRLFFALGVPERVSDQLDDLCEGVPHARWLLDNDYHITLSFLGDVPGHRVRELNEIARTIRRPPFEVALSSVGVFPNRGQPRVLWSGVQSHEPLLALQRTLQTELRNGGFDVDKRKFRPHVTVARVERCRQEAIFEWLGHNLGFSSDPFKVFRFHLLSSVLTSQGSLYTIEETFPLKGLV